MLDTLIRPTRDTRLNDSVPTRTSPAVLTDLERDGARFRKLARMLNRGDWSAHPIVGSNGAGCIDGGPAIVDLQHLRTAVDNSTPSPSLGGVQ